MLKKMLTISGLCLFALAAAGVGRADTMTFTLTVDGCSGSGCGTGPYGTITLTQNGSNVDVTETLASGYYFVNTGTSTGNEPLEFNLSSGGTITNVQSSTYFAAGTASSYSASIFGNFTNAIVCTTACGNGASNAFNIPQTLSFTVDGVTLSDFVGNGSTPSTGYFFASDVGEAGYSNDVWTIIATGNVGSNGPSTPVIPEPPSLLLLGTGLAALAGMMKLKAMA
ncbi:MAG TPA: PEP-CTERM sorting domain-containing protein [Terracidiphilus sp.]|nr:PEP-CTERM sorting domain-containing protein [Terracidiphilus sp.]